MFWLEMRAIRSLLNAARGVVKASNERCESEQALKFEGIQDIQYCHCSGSNLFPCRKHDKNEAEKTFSAPFPNLSPERLAPPQCVVLQREKWRGNITLA